MSRLKWPDSTNSVSEKPGTIHWASRHARTQLTIQVERTGSEGSPRGQACCRVFLLASQWIEVKGLGAPTGTILITPNERRVAEDHPDCFWLYDVTDCGKTPRLQEPIRDPARLDWHEVTKVAHYSLAVNAMAKLRRVRDDSSPDGRDA